MTTDRLEVHIELDGQTVPMGEVELVDRRGRTVRSEFAYRSSYLARSGVPALDPATRLDAARHVTESLPRGLRDAGPDGWGRRLILRALRGQVPSEADFLLAVDDFSRIGALRLRADADGPFLSERHDVPQLIDLEALAAAAERVEVDADDMAAVRQLLDAGTASLGGARPKASVADGERLLIAKFASPTDRQRDGIEVVAWESLCLDLADRAGIRVPPHRLAPVGGSRALVLDRFDRHGARRIPYLSAFALTDAPDAAAGDYAEVAEALADIDVDRLSETLRDLWRRIAFSIAMHNTDDHLKNHGVLRGRHGWQLSPAFDITPNPVGGAERATSINGETGAASEARTLVVLAKRWGIAEPEWRTILTDVLVVASGWREHARSLAIADDEIRLLDRVLTDCQRRLADLAG